MTQLRDETTARSPAAPPTAATTLENPWRAIRPTVEMLNAGSETKTFTEHALRHYHRDQDKNGLREADVFRRIGAKVLVNVPRFIGWLENGASPKAPPPSRAPRSRRRGAA
jgi:hypothetical protein